MATVKKGITVQTPEWWKHLRKFVHRRFWKRQRQADKKIARDVSHECGTCHAPLDRDGQCPNN